MLLVVRVGFVRVGVLRVGVITLGVVRQVRVLPVRAARRTARTVTVCGRQVPAAGSCLLWPAHLDPLVATFPTSYQ